MTIMRKTGTPAGYAKIPLWVDDLESFREWSDSTDFPEVGRISYYCGVVRVDKSKEQLFSHVEIKSACCATLRALTRRAKLGRFFYDGAYVTNELADISCVPDGVFASRASIENARVRFIRGRFQGYVEIEGSPDMVLEIVSDRSVTKDTVEMPRLYFVAGITEYWLIDARSDPVSFEILRRNSKGFVNVRKAGGWLKSEVFGKSFRVEKEVGDDGHPEFTLLMK